MVIHRISELLCYNYLEIIYSVNNKYKWFINKYYYCIDINKLTSLANNILKLS